MRALLLALTLIAGPAMAEAPETSPRPEDRPTTGPVEQVLRQIVRPRAPTITSGARRTLVLLSPRPLARPENLQRRATVAATRMASATPRVAVEGVSLCGFDDVVGDRLRPIQGRISACGVSEPVRVRGVAGIALSQGAVMDCRTAGALRQWVTGSARPTIGRLGGGLVQLQVAAHYACRTRNNRPGAKISEHGKGRAIDISGFRLANGQTLTVLRGWRGPHGDRLRKMHRDACGPFGTVLGPDGDRYHQDHFHLDTARYRSGTYCR